MKGYWLHYDTSYLSNYAKFGQTKLGKTFIIEKIDVEKLLKIGDILSLIKSNPDFIVLPLSLERHISLAIAEYVHLLDLNICLVLISRTEISKIELLKLYDVCFSSFPMPDTFLTSIAESKKDRIKGEELELALRRVSFAGCFMPIPDRHPELYQDYRQSTLFISEGERTDSWGCTHVSDRIFISYSHKDAKWLNRLRIHLRPIEREGLIDSWSDVNIEVGDAWESKINFSLKRANIFILLVSADFLASDFIANKELPHIIETAKKGYKKIVPIVLSPCGYEYSELNNFQAINSPTKGLIGLSLNKQEEVFAKVAKTIRTLFE